MDALESERGFGFLNIDIMSKFELSYLYGARNFVKEGLTNISHISNAVILKENQVHLLQSLFDGLCSLVF